MAVQLRHAVRAARVERRAFALPLVLDLAEHLARRRLIEADLRIDLADRFQTVDHADRIDLRRMRGLVPRGADEALRGEVVKLGRLDTANRKEDGAEIGDVPVHELDAIEHAELPQPPERIASAPGLKPVTR